MLGAGRRPTATTVHEKAICSSGATRSRQEALISGCSFAFGALLSDRDTAASELDNTRFIKSLPKVLPHEID